MQTATITIVNTGRPALPPAQAARVLTALRRLRQERYDGSNAALGRAIGISGSAVGQLLATPPRNRPSAMTAEAVARLLGVAARDLLDGTASPTLPADVYPERGAALGRLRGLLHPDVEAQLRSVVIHDERRPTELDWVRLALAMAREHGDAVELASLLPHGRT